MPSAAQGALQWVSRRPPWGGVVWYGRGEVSGPRPAVNLAWLHDYLLEVSPRRCLASERARLMAPFSSSRRSSSVSTG